jgi:hypothetical protein
MPTRKCEIWPPDGECDVLRKMRKLNFVGTQSLGTLASIAIRPASLTQTFDKLLASSGSDDEEVSDIATLGKLTTISLTRTPR